MLQDNLAEFELCPSSAAGQAICNSALDLKTNTFTASCDVEACSGACVPLSLSFPPSLLTLHELTPTSRSDCTATVVNKVTVDEDECFNSEKGATGIVTIDGEAKCGCASVRPASSPTAPLLQGLPLTPPSLAVQDDADSFSPCQAPANGRALCVATDADFLGSSPNDVATVECSYQCDDVRLVSPPPPRLPLVQHRR